MPEGSGVAGLKALAPPGEIAALTILTQAARAGPGVAGRGAGARCSPAVVSQPRSPRLPAQPRASEAGRPPAAGPPGTVPRPGRRPPSRPSPGPRPRGARGAARPRSSPSAPAPPARRRRLQPPPRVASRAPPPCGRGNPSLGHWGASLNRGAGGRPAPSFAWGLERDPLPPGQAAGGYFRVGLGVSAAEGGRGVGAAGAGPLNRRRRPRAGPRPRSPTASPLQTDVLRFPFSPRGGA